MDTKRNFWPQKAGRKYGGLERICYAIHAIQSRSELAAGSYDRLVYGCLYKVFTTVAKRLYVLRLCSFLFFYFFFGGGAMSRQGARHLPGTMAKRKTAQLRQGGDPSGRQLC